MSGGETLKPSTGEVKVHFNDQAPRGKPVLLYTVGGILTPGIWRDGCGYLGWSHYPTVDKQELAHCLANPHKGFLPIRKKD